MSSWTCLFIIWGASLFGFVVFIWGYALGRKDERAWWERFLNG